MLTKQFSFNNTVYLIGTPGCGKTYCAQVFANTLAHVVWIDGVDNSFHPAEMQECTSVEMLFLKYLRAVSELNVDDTFYFIFDNVDFDAVKFLYDVKHTHKVLIVCGTQTMINAVLEQDDKCALVGVQLFTCDEATTYMQECGVSGKLIGEFLKYASFNNMVLQRDARNFSKYCAKTSRPTLPAFLKQHVLEIAGVFKRV